MSYLGIKNNILKEKGAFWTAKEICQQVSSWQKTMLLLSEQNHQLLGFLDPIYKLSSLRIILTGAGTSAFAGGCIAPLLSNQLQKPIEAIATTDIVSNPQLYLFKDIPTLIVSYARSGNSPESVAAVEISKINISNCYHLIFTCNKDGKLNQVCKQDNDSYVVLLPKETNDQSFAMTSSFTSMMMASFYTLAQQTINNQSMSNISSACDALLTSQIKGIEKLALQNYSRVIYLGCGGLKALSQESALKLLELTNGNIIALHDSSLGFRHGPKTIINCETLVFIYISNEQYTRQYDIDLLNEIARDQEAGKVVAITANTEGLNEDSNYDIISLKSMEQASEQELLYPYIMVAQIYAFFHALQQKNKPDTPVASGSVNRVVQGVNIYPLKES